MPRPEPQPDSPEAGASQAERATRMALSAFLAGERLDMGRLAESLGVNRVTLYRWVGTRDQLLVDVLWSLAARVLNDLRDLTPGRGASRVVAVVTGFLAQIIDSPAMQRFLEQEGELALRLLTRSDRGFQPRLVAEVEDLLCEEGLDRLPLDVGELAFVVVRLVETYTYLDLITGQRPDPRRAAPVFALLLRTDATSPESVASGRSGVAR